MPPHALLISLGALAIPFSATSFGPELVEENFAILIWLPALVPAFLLTYYHGWSGASTALAAAMATLALSQAVIAFIGAPAPPWPVLLIVVGTCIFVSLGIGWFGELLLRARREAEALALLDPLTGLANRAYLRLFLDTAYGAAERGGQLVIVLFDLDRFKGINDRHGHVAGDETLVAFAGVLQTVTRRSDLSARFGGEEFLAVLTGHGGTAGAAVFAERVREALRAQNFPWGAVTVSAGIACYSEGMTAPEDVLVAADRALYRAKAEGRDRAVIADQRESHEGAVEPEETPPQRSARSSG